MTEANQKTRWVIIGATILLVTFSRLLPHVFGFTHLFNFSPIGGVALFGAAYFSRKEMSFLVPFLGLWLSNLVLDNVFYTQYYPSFAWFTNWEVYLSFAAIVVLGIVLLKKITLPRVVGTSLLGSVLFYLVSNFFVWFSYDMYPKTAEGLLASYVAAIPFFGNTVAGDLFYVTVLFGAFEWVKRRYPSLVLAQ